jgi:plasmid stabilization system protein ParE
MPPYIVFYRAIENGVEIVRFVDGRRDLRKLINA